MRQFTLLGDNPQLLHQQFLNTALGYLYLSIPWDELAAKIPPPPSSLSGLGRKPWFDVKGGIALQILKHNYQLSDARLIEHVNTNWAMQLFCGMQLKPGQKINDYDLPSDWRVYLGQYMDISKAQKQLAKHWKPHMEQTQTAGTDATCYESYIEFPTDVKLVWKGCEELYGHIQKMRKTKKLRPSRVNYPLRKKEYLTYQKSRKKTSKAEKKLRKKLLKFLARLIQQFDDLMKKQVFGFSKRKQKRIAAVMQLYRQQHDKAYGIIEKIENRIVNIAKEYIRPIVRGKEVKKVEFGAKVNKLQVDGISFIEYLSYDAFNEGTRLQSTVLMHQEYFGKCGQVSADKIYATNNNRTYCRKKGIVTSFQPKGKQKQEHIEQAALMRQLLDKERSTRLEGSFGNEKNHYLLEKVNARTKETETIWIFFGIHTANAVNIAKRMQAKERERDHTHPPPTELPLKQAA